MAKREKVIKGLECCMKWTGEPDTATCHCSDCSYTNMDILGQRCLIDLINDALALLKDAPEWISCDEREPEKYKLVIVLIYGHDVIIQQDGETLEDAIRRTMNKCRTSCGYLGGDGWCDSEGYPMIIKPSYWMKIPDPPERGFK